MKRKTILSALLLSLMCIATVPLSVKAAENSEGGRWVQEEQGNRYINADETSPMGSWWLIQGNWYYFNSSGYSMKGWVKDNTTWYYLDQQGAMKTGWLDDNGTWYYLQPNGAMVTGWLQLDASWYFFNASGARQTGWIEDKTNWYFLNDSGAMSIGSRTIDGSIYKFASTGQLNTVYVEGDEPYGSFNVLTYSDDEQAFADTINSIRGDKNQKALIVDQTLNAVAKERLNLAMSGKYLVKDKTITGQGDIKTYLKTIKYTSNKSVAEVYIRSASDVDNALYKFENETVSKPFYTRITNSKTYSRMGVAVAIKNDKYYVMFIMVQ